MDSPRGRIYLMEALLDGQLRLSPTVTQHFDRCLGCMACVTSCPSGVKYDRLIEQTRAHVEEQVERPLGERLLRVADLQRLPVSAADARSRSRCEPLGRRLPVPCVARAAARIAPPWRSARAAARADAGPSASAAGRVGLLHGLRPARRLRRRQRRDRAGARRRRARGRRAAARRAAARSQCTPGRLDEGLARARRLIDVVRARRRRPDRDERGRLRLEPEGLRFICSPTTRATPSGRAAFSAKVRDVSEVLAERAARRAHPLPISVAFQDSCHLLHAQRVRDAPQGGARGDPRPRPRRAGRAGALLR